MNALEFRAVDHEPIPDIARERPFPGVIDGSGRDQLDVADDAVTPAVVEHFLRLRQAPDWGTEDLATSENEGQRTEFQDVLSEGGMDGSSSRS